MIGYIKGTVEGIQTDSVLVENQGIGYRIFTSGLAINEIGTIHQQVQLFTYLHVRENEMSLFGFPTTEELDTFKMLIKVNGIGPKAALAILSVLSVRELALAVVSGDSKAIAKANGIGAKTAEKIIMELKDKLTLDDFFVSEDSSDMPNHSPGSEDSIQDTVLALVSLGYSDFEALRAIKQIPEAETMDSGELLKAALKKMM